MAGRGVSQPQLAKVNKSGRGRYIGSILIMLVAFVGSLRGPRQADAQATASAPAVSPAAYNPTEAADEDALLVKLLDAKTAERKKLLQSLAQTGDLRLDPIFKDLTEGSLYVWNGHAVTCEKIEGSGGKALAPLMNPFTRQAIMAEGKQVKVPEKDVDLIDLSRREKVFVRDATSLLRLYNPDAKARLAAVIKSGENQVEENLPALQELQKTEKVKAVQRAIAESIALIQLSKSGDDAETKEIRLSAARTLGEMSSGRALDRLKELKKAEKDPNASKVYADAIARIEHWQSVVEWIGVAFSGLSASSILILMALGLSIIFGLMGVINMAHGELMMLGAYATYFTQQAFVKYLPPSAFDWYFVVAIPVAFVVAGVAGMILEATVIRFLYGRPLETLLATFGVGYILVQIIRVQVGDNIGVNSPTWLRGSYEIMQDVQLPYNRLFIIAFCVACVGLMYFILDRTKMGLLIRATTQNRTMAASLGVNTRRIDMLTFGLGAGLAGMAGCALTQVGGVTPDMGQNYIIDSFLVVVTGGVGKLAGAIWAGLGLGVTNKLLEPFFATVWAKVIILMMVVIFLQRRPSGLFPAKGRLADV